MPAQSPLDLLNVYMTPSAHGVGQRLSLSSIDQELGRLPIRPVLRLLALTAFRADKSMSDPRERIALMEDLLPEGAVKDRARPLVDRGAFFVSSQHALALAVRALVACPMDATDASADLPHRLGRLLLALGDHLAATGPTPRDRLTLELVRVGMHYQLYGAFDWYAAAEGVFFQTLPAMTNDPDYIDVPAVFAEDVGIDMPTFWAISAIVGMVVMTGDQLQTFPVPIAGVDERLTATWGKVLTQTVAEARSAATEAVNSWSPWSHGIFYSRPILAGINETSDLVMRPRLIAHKATVTGMYHLVFDLLRSRGDDSHMRWSRFFGRVIERYGREQLGSGLASSARLTFPDQRSPSDRHRPACDVLVKEHRSCVALDFVHRILSLSTQTTGSGEDLARDLEFAVVEKASQIDETLADAVAQDASLDRLIPVVVMSGHLPLSPLLSARIRELTAALPRQVVGVDGRCRPLAVLELHELNMLLATAALNRLPIADVLDRWLGSPLAENNFRDWLVAQDDITPARAGAEGPWYERISALFPNGLTPPAPHGDDAP